MAVVQKTIKGLTNNETYYVRTYVVNPDGMMQSELGGQVVSAVIAAFPSEPSEYSLIDTYTTATTFTAPEDGWYQIELHGASGNGASAVGFGVNGDYAVIAGGGGGGGGGCAISRVKLNKGDTIVFTSIAVGSTAAVYINSSIETYANMLVLSGTNGNAGSISMSSNKATGGTGGSGGAASGGNYANYNGNNGDAGTGRNSAKAGYTAPGGTGGAPGHSGGNTGGTGGSATVSSVTGQESNINKSSGDAGKSAFMKIYRGNTNVA